MPYTFWVGDGTPFAAVSGVTITDSPRILALSERVYALDFGRVIAEGSPDEITKDERVLSSYLGRTRRAHAPA